MKQIFLHGLGQTPESWEKVFLQLEFSGHSMCPDLSQILQGKEATYQNLYEAVSTLCSQRGEKVDLYGLSLGGVLALNYAIEHPQRVNSLTLIAPQYKMPKNLMKLQNFLFRFMPGSLFQSTGFEKKAFIQLCKTMMKLDFSDSLSKITCPTLILYGERDSANKKAAIELANLVKNARIQEIVGAGHEVNRDAPEKLSEILDDFYRQTR